jgi:hypothetical protein
MSQRPSTFPTELGIATRVGLTRGLGELPGLKSFAEIEMYHRQDRLIADARRHSRRNGHSPSTNASQNRRERVSRWSTWLPSVPFHRSSPAPQSSAVCGN